MKTRLKKMLALLLTLSMCLTLLPLGAMAAEEPILLAGWVWTEHPYGKNGTKAKIALPTTIAGGVTAGLTYSNIANNTADTYTASMKSISTNEWGSGTEYWQIAINTTGYTQLSLTFDAYGSATGPRDFKVQISQNGVDFYDVTDGGYTLSATGATIKTRLPLVSGGAVANIDNAATAVIRLQNTSTQPIDPGKASSVAPTGTSRLYNIKVEGVAATVTPPPKAATPVAAPSETAVTAGTAITLTGATPGADIYYTLDGTQPTAASTRYAAPIVIDAAKILKAVAIKNGMENSDVLTLTYSIIVPVVIPPLPARGGGAATPGERIPVTCPTADATIQYNLTSATADESLWQPLADNVLVMPAAEGTFTAYLRAVKNGMTTSPVFTAVYQVSATPVETVAPVRADTAEGAVLLGAQVRLSTATADAAIYYTTDKSEPTAASALYTGAITLSTLPMTIKAVAVKGSAQSAVATYAYTQLQAGGVTCNRTDGSKLTAAVDQITFTAGAGEIVKYVMTSRVGQPGQTVGAETAYDSAAPITVAEADFPVSFTVWATRAGCLDGAKSTLGFALKAAGEFKNYFGQLHSHTAENSDGSGTLEEAFDYAANQSGVDFLAVTDHSNAFDTANKADTAATYNLTTYNADNAKWVKGHTMADKYTDSTFVGMYGYEMTWSGGPGHINTFATNGFVSRNNTILNSKAGDAGLKAYYELLSRPDSAASISQFNHPGPTFGNFSNFGYWNPVVDSRICLIEVGNGEGAVGSGGYFPSYSEYTLALDKGWHLAPTNNQDNHQKKWGDANTARTVVYTDNFTREGLYQAMREMRVYATEDKNLDIVYTLNGSPLGTTLEAVPAAADFRVAVKDPDSSDKIASISIISVGGKVVYELKPGTQNYALEYSLPNPTAGYYYIRVQQADKDIAVTAPVWLGAAKAVGMSALTTDAYMAVKGESMKLTASFFNNETAPATLKSLTYALKGGETLATLTPNVPIPSSATLAQTYDYIPAVTGNQTVTLTAVVSLGGEDKTFTGELTLDVRDPEKLIYVGVDGSHYNEYVSGNYKDSMGNFAKLAGGHNVRVNVLKTSDELMAALQNPKYKMMVFTAPTRRLTGVTYADYSTAELAAVAAFAQRGGTVAITGWGDYYESYPTSPKEPERQMAAQQNKLLKAVGSSLRLADDEAKDNTNNPGSNAARLYLTDYNGFRSPLLTGVNPKQVFSQYGGCTVFAVDSQNKPSATLPAGVTPVISGYGALNSDGTGKVLDAIASEDDDKDGYGIESGTQKPPRYTSDNGATVLLTAHETVQQPGGSSSLVVVSGGAFMSNFEIKADLENSTSLNYSNYNFLENLIETLNVPTVSTIADVTSTGQKGDSFVIEGTVMSTVWNGSDDNTGFFDCIYVQDATGGINVFPVSSGVEPGQRVRVTGVYDAYEGERQLQSAKVKVLSSTPGAIPTPREISTKDAAGQTYLGQLVKVTGRVVSVDQSAGVVNSFQLQDDSGTACKVFIDGYITKGKTIPGLAPGKTFSAVGFASYNKDSARIRVRDRAEITPVQTQESGKIVILHTNDVHCAIDRVIDAKTGKITGIGYAGVAAYRDEMENTYGAGNVTLVDAGDAIQGGPIGTLSKGSYIVDIMNKVGYDIAIPGNHEFDYGMDNFLTLAKNKADYTYLSSNFNKKDAGTVFAGAQVITYGDTQVAYVGITTPETFTKSTPTYFQDANGNYIYGFCEGGNGKDLYNRVQETVNAVREAGADYVVAVGHLGIDEASKPWTSSEVIANTTGIDLLIDGHSHSVFKTLVRNKAGKEVLMAQTGTKLGNLGKVVIDTKTGAISCELVTEYAPQQAETADYIKTINDEFKGVLKKVVAKTDVALTTLDPDTGKRAVRSAETNLGDLCADAYRVMLGADVAFVNGGGVRADIKAGDITYEQIINVHPFGNEACMVQTTGQKLLDALEMGARAVPGENGGFLQVSGLTYTVVKSVPSSVVLNDKGEFVKVNGPYRVTNVMVGGAPLDLGKTYTLAAHNYMLKSGGDGFTMFKGDKLIKDCVMIDNQVLINYMVEKLGGVVGKDYANPRGQGRISIVDTLPPVATPSAPTATVKEGTASLTVKLPTVGTRLTASAMAKAVAANAAKPVLLTAPGLAVTIPAGTLAKGANINAMVVNPKGTGNAIQVTRGDGSTVILPFAVVGGGSARYLADVQGTYKLVDNTKTFADTESHWAKDAIAFAASHELFKGGADGAFRPEQPMTRGMLVTVLSRLDGGSVATGSSFSDVSASAWYAGEVAWAARNGIVEGDGASFNPDATLTREQLCVILARYLKHSGLTLTESKTVGEYTDMGSVSPWARAAVEQALKTGLLDGKTGGLLDPQGQASRAEIAVILRRFIEGVLK